MTKLSPYKTRTIQKVLDDIKAKHNLPSDYKLALFLGLGETAVANYRNGRSLPDASTAIIIAKAVGEEPALIMMEIEAQRAKSMPVKLAWSAALTFVAYGIGRISIGAPDQPVFADGTPATTKKTKRAVMSNK